MDKLNKNDNEFEVDDFSDEYNVNKNSNDELIDLHKNSREIKVMNS